MAKCDLCSRSGKIVGDETMHFEPAYTDEDYESLQQENKTLREDARRYHFLRSKDLETISCGGIFAGKTPDNLVINGEDLDREIDKALEGGMGMTQELDKAITAQKNLEHFLKEAFCIDGECHMLIKEVNLNEKMPVFELTDSKRGTFNLILLNDDVRAALEAARSE